MTEYLRNTTTCRNGPAKRPCSGWNIQDDQMQSRTRIRSGSRAGIFLAVLLLTAGIAAVFPVAYAADTSGREILYKTEFSTNPEWQTNSPSRYYWDQANQRYHYRSEPGSGSYAYVNIDYAGTPFTLEYDVTPVTTGQNTAFRFGFGGSTMDINSGPSVLTYFINTKYGNLMGFRAIAASHMQDITSYAYSYGGTNGNSPTIRYEDGKTYHVTAQYDPGTDTVTMRVVNAGTGSQVWSYFVTSVGDLRRMNRLYITTVGDYQSTSAYSEGYIDNIVLSAPAAATPTPTAPVQATAPAATRTSTSRPTASSPTPAPTQSPLSSLVALGALGLATLSLIVLTRNRGT